MKSAAVASKTLTIPQGVSLMQVFRDNHLNISDVNAMTKANGAGNNPSSFKRAIKYKCRLTAKVVLTNCACSIACVLFVKRTVLINIKNNKVGIIPPTVTIVIVP